jgi:hypothetical protein
MQQPAPKLGPDGFDKIAIIGSAPSSVRLAPYTDPTWAIWGCSPGAYGEIPPGRSDVFFEIHRWEPAAPGQPNNPANKPWFSPEYVRFLEQHPGTVYMAEQVPTVRNCVVYPFAEMEAEFGPYFWTSSLAYMLALAIKLRPRAIGLWGVDMAAHSEYAFQRPGCQNFIGIAASLGIKIVVPLESDLLQPPTPYGKIENHPRHAKLLVRRNELAVRMNAHQQNVAMNQAQVEFCRGALDNLDYILSTWTADVDPGLEASEAIAHSAMVAGRAVAIEAALHRFEESSVPLPLELDPPVLPEGFQPAPPPSPPAGETARPNAGAEHPQMERIELPAALPKARTRKRRR